MSTVSRLSTRGNPIVPSISVFLTALFLVLPFRTALAELTFGPAKNYPAIGLTFPTLFRAAGDPVPMPKAHAYLPVNTSDTLTREDRFAPFDLWYNSQCCARWRDPDGRELILGRVTHSYPQTEEKHISRERFKLEVARTGSRPDPKNLESLTEWVATFAGVAVYPPKKCDINKFALDGVCRFENETPNLLIYAFRPRKSGSNSVNDWFCVTLQLVSGDNPELAAKCFEEDFLAQISLPSRGSKEEGVKATEFDMRDTKGKVAERIDNPVRDEARKSVENYDDWWIAETEGYMILSDVYSEVGKGIIRELQKQLPLLQKTCMKLLPPLAPLNNEIALIRLFQRQEDYVRYLGEDMAWSGGAWVPSRRELVLFQKGGIEEMMPTILHEAFHQYLSYAYAMIQSAPWLNEGHACFFAPAWIGSKGQMLIAEDEDRAKFLVENIDLAAPLLPLLIEMGYDEFYEGTQSEKLLKYAMAWGLVYFLQKGVPTSVVPETYASILPNYRSTLAKTRDEHKATLAAFEEIEMETFQEAFRNFWLSDRSHALKYDPAEGKKK